VIAIQNFPFFGVVNQGGPVGGAGGGGAAPQGAPLGGGGAPIQQPNVQVIGLDINASAPVAIKRPGPGPVLQQQGMFLIEISPP
jgi:hypothetical protein